MTVAARMRGQPVLALALLLGGWVALRAALWETPFAAPLAELPGALFIDAASAPQLEPEPAQAIQALAAAPGDAPHGAGLAAPSAPDPASRAAAGLLADPWHPALRPFAPTAPMPPRLFAAHTMLFMSGLAALPLPADLAGLITPGERPQSAPYQPLTTFAASRAGTRWSGDAWLLLRRDTTTALTSGRGSYGRSQAGAVLRYALAPFSPFRPFAYSRVSQALRAQDSELALGLSARVLPNVPLRAAAELRASRTNGGTLLRPAAYLVTELPPLALPLGFAAEAYGQAGYVGGHYASAFADGQLRAERPIAELGSFRLDAGGGAWAGAQKGAARLDIGPSASVRLKLGPASARASMDWRFRVAGEAEPSSGPALTISAGF